MTLFATYKDKSDGVIRFYDLKERRKPDCHCAYLRGVHFDVVPIFVSDRLAAVRLL